MIKMIVTDIDGTLTDGKIYLYSCNDKILETKSFHVKDGLGIVKWLKSGGLIAAISGRKCEITKERLRALGIKDIFLGIDSKKQIMQDLMQKYAIKDKEIAAIGDDDNDVDILKMAKYSFAPKNASKNVLKVAKYRLKSKGGEGAVREMIEKIIKLNLKNTCKTL